MPDSHTFPDPLSPKDARRLEKRWEKAYNAVTEAELQSFYDDWAGSYDADHAAIGCFHHETAAALLARHLPDKAAAVVDAGAGTGLAGQSMRALGYTNLTAIDFSAEILAVARLKGIYREYRVMNLNEPLADLPDARFDAALAVGVFSYGQVAARALDELVRIVRKEGLITLTLRQEFYADDAMGVRSKMDALIENGRWQLLERTPPAQYLPNKEPEVMFRAWLFKNVKRKT